MRRSSTEVRLIWFCCGLSRETSLTQEHHRLSSAFFRTQGGFHALRRPQPLGYTGHPTVPLTGRTHGQQAWHRLARRSHPSARPSCQVDVMRFALPADPARVSIDEHTIHLASGASEDPERILGLGGPPPNPPAFPPPQQLPWYFR